MALLEAGLAWRHPGRPTSRAPKGPWTTSPPPSSPPGRRASGSGASPPRLSVEFRGRPAPEAYPEEGEVEEAPLSTVDRNTSKKTGSDAECAMAKNPVNPSQLFVFCNTSGPGLFAARSTDAGATWFYPDPSDKTIADGDAGQGTSGCCDPSLAWDSFGNLFISYLGNSVDTLLSTDGGATFTQLPLLGNGSVDQQTIVTADLTGGGHVVWVVWNQGSMRAAGAVVTDLGAVGAWSAEQSANTSGCSFGDIAVAPNGAVVQVCTPSSGQNGGSITVNTDPDGIGGAGFNAAVSAGNTNVGGFDFIPPQNSRSIDPECGLAYNRNPASPHFGRLYLVYTDETVNENNDTEILFRWSDDDGATWSTPPVRVNDDATTRSQFLPKMASDPETGNVAVCWHDARNSATNTAAELFCSSMSDTATRFQPNQKVSDGASVSNGAGVEFGDYAGIAVFGSEARPVWGDTSNSTGDNPNGTGSFDAYSDFFTVPLFADGFEAGTFVAWEVLTKP
ncbi:MAG: sialidase family protein [Thermoanaerobaculia bacterium]